MRIIYDTDNPGPLLFNTNIGPDSTNLDGSPIVGHWINQQCVAAIVDMARSGGGCKVMLHASSTAILFEHLAVAQVLDQIELARKQQ